MSCDHELANEWLHCSGKNASYITIALVHCFWSKETSPSWLHILCYRFDETAVEFLKNAHRLFHATYHIHHNYPFMPNLPFLISQHFFPPVICRTDETHACWQSGSSAWLIHCLTVSSAHHAGVWSTSLYSSRISGPRQLTRWTWGESGDPRP